MRERLSTSFFGALRSLSGGISAATVALRGGGGVRTRVREIFPVHISALSRAGHLGRGGQADAITNSAATARLTAVDESFACVDFTVANALFPV